MEILTIFLWVSGAIICVRLAVNLVLQCFTDFLKVIEEVAAARHDAAELNAGIVREFLQRLSGTKTEPVVKLLEAVTARLAPEVQKTKGEPMPASLITWIDTWPDQWAIDQQTVLAQKMYEDYGNWDQVGNALIAEAKRTEIPDDDGLLQY